MEKGRRDRPRLTSHRRTPKRSTPCEDSIEDAVSAPTTPINGMVHDQPDEQLAKATPKMSNSAIHNSLDRPSIAKSCIPKSSYASLNIRGLNWPNKQDDVKIFLQLNNVVHVLSTSAQHVHCRVCQQNDMQDFYTTYVYGENQEGLRHSLWQTLRDIEATMDEAWCVLGDFNSVL
ncbi:hypothetical protein Cgig2_027213 [Carnegiea gigantea]|uniref:Uncharacterized protein n=1 Tax=Carnegiea gigantea TaxID=171969 RepID=A0A9Q1GRJ7_9CARY|nr:hypothetical protein Cgig2_027213 [Carnegiea gigantea]